MATDLDRWVFSLSLRRISASSLQQFPRKSTLKSQIQLSQYDRCHTQRPKECKECRLFQIYQSALGFLQFFGFPRTHRVVCLWFCLDLLLRWRSREKFHKLLHLTRDVTGQHYRPVPSDVSLPSLRERRRRLKFRLEIKLIFENFLS